MKCVSERRRWEDLPGFYRYLSIPELKSNVRTLVEPNRTIRCDRTRIGNGRAFFLAMKKPGDGARLGRARAGSFWLQLIVMRLMSRISLSSDLLLSIWKGGGEPMDLSGSARLNCESRRRGFEGSSLSSCAQ